MRARIPCRRECAESPPYLLAINPLHIAAPTASGIFPAIAAGTSTRVYPCRFAPGAQASAPHPSASRAFCGAAPRGPHLPCSVSDRQAAHPDCAGAAAVSRQSSSPWIPRPPRPHPCAASSWQRDTCVRASPAQRQQTRLSDHPWLHILFSYPDTLIRAASRAKLSQFCKFMNDPPADWGSRGIGLFKAQKMSRASIIFPL